jgi:hypothetical protein
MSALYGIYAIVSVRDRNTATEHIRLQYQLLIVDFAVALADPSVTIRLTRRQRIDVLVTPPFYRSDFLARFALTASPFAQRSLREPLPTKPWMEKADSIATGPQFLRPAAARSR